MAEEPTPVQQRFLDTSRPSTQSGEGLGVASAIFGVLTLLIGIGNAVGVLLLLLLFFSYYYLIFQGLLALLAIAFGIGAITRNVGEGRLGGIIGISTAVLGSVLTTYIAYGFFSFFAAGGQL